MMVEKLVEQRIGILGPVHLQGPHCLKNDHRAHSHASELGESVEDHDSRFYYVRVPMISLELYILVHVTLEEGLPRYS